MHLRELIPVDSVYLMQGMENNYTYVLEDITNLHQSAMGNYSLPRLGNLAMKSKVQIFLMN